MKTKIIIASALMPVGRSAAVLPAAEAQGIAGGAQRGADEGNRAAGPIGAVVGGVVGGVTAGVAGLLGVDQRPRFREYVVRERRQSYRWDGQLSVGSEQPEDGVVYYQVPPEYGARGYRYTVVNGQTVLVDPRPVVLSTERLL
jgi:hypothetical protein